MTLERAAGVWDGGTETMGSALPGTGATVHLLVLQQQQGSIGPLGLRLTVGVIRTRPLYAEFCPDRTSISSTPLLPRYSNEGWKRSSGLPGF